ncbi:MAG: thiamine pyrophosphate-requiring protein [Phycisphaeraceae bacterium]
MAGTCSDFLVDRLVEWGVDRVYGYPGDGINSFMGALDRKKEKIRFIRTAHEEIAAFAACAHAKFTGKVGVCMATSGPGAIHLLNGLYDAKKDHVPVVAIVGQQPRMALGSDFQQEVDLGSLFKDVASDYVAQAAVPLNIRTMVDQAMRVAMAGKTVTCVIVPHDLQKQDAQITPPRKHGATLTGVGYRPPRIVPEEADLDAAAAVLNQGKRVSILIGAGAREAADEVMGLADKLGCGVAKALLGKDVIDDDLPYCTGAIGLLGTRPSWDMMMGCDALLLIGTSFPYSEFLPREGQARCVQIDIKPKNLSLRYPAEVPLHGDAKSTLQALLPKLKFKQDRSWREQIEEGVRDWWDKLEDRAYQSARPINPQRVCWELSSRLPDTAVVTADSGSAANWYARDLKLKRGMRGTLSGGLATMCPGVPYALAAKFAWPERPAIALVGDGAMQMLGNAAMIDVAEHWEEWIDKRLVICVFNNHDLNQVTWEQRVMDGNPRFEASQNIRPFNYAQYAEQLGYRGIRVEDPDHLGPAWEEALAADQPVVVDAVTDPDVPPIPPHITFEQARSYLESMAKGDPDTMGMVKQSFQDTMATWLPESR